MNLIEILQEMPPVQWVVVTTLAIMSLSAFGVTISRLIAFGKSRGQSLAFVRFSGPLLEDEALGKVIDGSAETHYQMGYATRIIRAGLEDAEDVLRVRGKLDDLSTVSSAMNRASDQEMAFLRRWTAIVATVGASAPFVGLLGTVLGILAAFHSIQESGSAGLDAVAGDIGEALIVTALGLAVAIPATWMYNYFTTRLDDFTVRLEGVSSEMLDYLAKRAHKLTPEHFVRPASPKRVQPTSSGVEA